MTIPTSLQPLAAEETQTVAEYVFEWRTEGPWQRLTSVVDRGWAEELLRAHRQHEELHPSGCEFRLVEVITITTRRVLDV